MASVLPPLEVKHEQLAQIKQHSLDLLQAHATGHERIDRDPLTGEFSLLPHQTEPDLYGMIDAAYILHTLGELPARTNRDSRQQWAQRILDCQGEQGWFTKRNLRGHSREHATAYAIGALRLLEMEPDERYVDDVRPLLGIKPLLTDERAFKFWLNWLDFRPTPQSVRQKKLGWHYIWRGSHVGGGIPAAVGMTQHLVDDWWPGKVDVAQWLNKYFDWLDAHASARTGYWQRAFWNLAYRRPTIIDMGGAVHFFWVYAACDRGFPYPAPVVKSTISLQKPTGLYKQHPFCIDLDGNFCIIRAFNQLSAAEQARREADVQRAINANFEGVTRALLERPFGEIYSDSHGLPGALVALVECAKLPGFAHAEAVADWQNPLDKAWWL